MTLKVCFAEAPPLVSTPSPLSNPFPLVSIGCTHFLESLLLC